MCGFGEAKRRYLGKLSGPLLDRVDLRVEMRRTTLSRSRMSIPCRVRFRLVGVATPRGWQIT
jgi:predicted ATPase with chaperone activity